MKIFTLPRKKNLYATSIIIASLLVIVFIIQDPFSLQNPNTKINLNQEELVSVSSLISEKCLLEQGQNRATCYRNEMDTVSETYGLLTSETVLVKIQEKDDLIKSCHLLGHYIGNGSYKRASWQFWKLMDSVNVNLCGSGIMHGIVEAYIGDHPEIELGGEFATKICGKSSFDTYFQSRCVHLLGHMILLSTYGNFKEAEPRCETVDVKWRYHCYNGLFMEDHQKLMLQDHAIMEKPIFTEAYLEGIHQKCLLQDGIAATACWTEMAEPYLKTYGYDPEIAYTNCSKAPTKQLVDACYMKGVVAMATMPSFATAAKLASICSYYTKEQHTYNRCIDSLILSNLLNSPTFLPRVLNFCLGEDPSRQQYCYKTIVQRLSEAVPNIQKRNDYCEQLPHNYIVDCKKEGTVY